MELTPVTSSNIEAVGYDAANSELVVKFKHGLVYAYEDVPETVFSDLMKASSIGAFFAANIRNTYPTNRL